jgi:uncharacterized membrane protein YebE (DUF533 family)
MSNKLPKQAFVALLSVGWADGALARSEAAALVHAARQHGLADADVAEIEVATKSPVALAAFDPGEMTPWERVVTYALASWLARLDGVESRSETTTLKALGERLGLAEAVRERAAAAAFDVAVLPESARPERYDFDKLVARLHAKLPQITGS